MKHGYNIYTYILYNIYIYRWVVLWFPSTQRITDLSKLPIILGWDGMVRDGRGTPEMWIFCILWSSMLNCSAWTRMSGPSDLLVFKIRLSFPVFQPSSALPNSWSSNSAKIFKSPFSQGFFHGGYPGTPKIWMVYVSYEIPIVLLFKSHQATKKTWHS